MRGNITIKKISMKTIFIITVLFLTLSASLCNKEECHRTITIKNVSSQKVIYSSILYDGLNPSKCLLTKNAELNSNDFYIQESRSCWEDRLKNRNFEFYIVDPSNFNTGSFYSCDSIEIKNTILKHYVLTLDDLKQSNFIVTYP